METVTLEQGTWLYSKEKDRSCVPKQRPGSQLQVQTYHIFKQSPDLFCSHVLMKKPATHTIKLDKDTKKIGMLITVWWNKTLGNYNTKHFCRQ